MKKIFIYYSLSGNGDLVAEKLKEKDIDIRKVYITKELPKIKFFKFLICGMNASRGKKEELKDFDSNVNGYDEIIIGSPIWASRLSCPINTVLDKINIENKKITFILYSSSGDSPKATELIKQKYPDATIINLKEPKDNQEALNKIEI